MSTFEKIANVVIVVIGLTIAGLAAYVYYSIDSANDANQVVLSATDIKQMAMLDPIIHVVNEESSGSGVLVFRDGPDEKGRYWYLAITNAHVVDNREILKDIDVDGLRGTVEYVMEDPGCSVTVFRHEATEWEIYDATILIESEDYDLAVVSFFTEDLIENIARIASAEQMMDVRIFDEVFAVGCQLGKKPLPTKGLVSAFYLQEDILMFSHTAQISPGSSGGGLFKEYEGEYYLIGMPSSVACVGFQFVAHYAYSISATVIHEFLEENSMTFITKLNQDLVETNEN